MDYAERVALSNNRMDFEMSNPAMDYTNCNLDHTNGTLDQPPQVNNEAVPNASCQTEASTMPFTPSTIPYKANSPADPNLWDGHFGSISLFGTNEFLQSDACNILCSLIQIAQFIRQRNITDCDGNSIPQLNSFGDAVFDFISALHEAGWNKLNTSDNQPIGNKVKDQFGNHLSVGKEKSRIPMEKIPPQIPP